MTSPPLLRPLHTGELLDEVLELYRANWLLFITIVAVTQIPLLLVSLALGMPHFEGPTRFGGSFWLNLGIAAFFSVLQSAALLSAASNRYLHRRASLAGAYRHALHRWLPLAGFKLVQYTLLGVGLTCLVIPGIVFAFWTAFISPVFILEGTGWSTTWERSRFLSADQWGRIFTFYLLTTLFVSTFTLQIIVCNQFLVHNEMLKWHLSQVFGAISNLAFMPLWTCATLLLYYDVRVRKEAFDLQLRAEALASA